MEVIARTEVLRAHNQGRIKFHDRVGVRKLEWMTMEDERVCPICGPLDGKVFDTGRFPSQPAHPNCRCTSVVAWPLVICGGELGAKAAAEPDACILPPQTVEAQAKAKSEEDAKLKDAFESGKVADLNTLTVKQLQTLAKQNGVSIARTKSDFIKLLDQVEPGIDHSDLTGAALKAKLKDHKIGLLRTKEDLIGLLAQKQRALKKAQIVSERLKKGEGLHVLTVEELQEVARTKGVSIYMTKKDVIDLLDRLEPEVDHSGLRGKSLVEVQNRYQIPTTKNKRQLIKAIEEAAREEAAERIKREALNLLKE
jgi:hypothetical protein